VRVVRFTTFGARLGYASLTLALLLLLTAPTLVEAGKGKKKEPKYAASMSVTGHMSASIDCEAWTSDWTYGGEYSPTRLESAASLDARSRSGGGSIDWSRDTCPPLTPTSGNCPIVVDSPESGGFAGDEDGFLQKAAGGFRVRLDFTQFMVPVGTAETCRGAVYSPSAQGAQETPPGGFIPRAKIGKKLITVPIAGSFTLVDGSDGSEGQINGTLTLTRQGKK